MQHLHTQRLLKVLCMIAQNNQVLFFCFVLVQKCISKIGNKSPISLSRRLLPSWGPADIRQNLQRAVTRYAAAVSKWSRRSRITLPSGQPTPQVPRSHGRTPSWRDPAAADTYRGAGPDGTRVLHLRGAAQRQGPEAQRHQGAAQASLQQPQPEQWAGGQRGARAAAWRRARTEGRRREPGGSGGQRAPRRLGQRDQSLERAAGPRQHHRRRHGRCRQRLAAGDRCGWRAGPGGAAPPPPPWQPLRLWLPAALPLLRLSCRLPSAPLRATPAPASTPGGAGATPGAGAEPGARCFAGARPPSPALPDPEPSVPSRVSPLMLLQPFCNSFGGVYPSTCSCAPSLALLLCPFIPGHCCYRALWVEF